jgi:hypothetical protein
MVYLYRLSIVSLKTPKLGQYKKKRFGTPSRKPNTYFLGDCPRLPCFA